MGWSAARKLRRALEALTGVSGAGEDRFLAPELAAAEAFVGDGSLVAAAESVTGTLA
jgi:histidine ammonia-lyase